MAPPTVHRLGDVVRELLGLNCDRIILSPNYRATWDEQQLAAAAGGLREASGGSACTARCQLAGREFAVAPSGNLYTCAQIVGEDRNPDLIIGHVERGFDADAIALLQQSKERVDDICVDCALRSRCDSHCGCKHVALTGEMGKITGVLCEIEEQFITAADHVGDTLHAEACDAFLHLFYRQRWEPAQGAELISLRRSRGA